MSIDINPQEALQSEEKTRAAEIAASDQEDQPAALPSKDGSLEGVYARWGAKYNKEGGRPVLEEKEVDDEYNQDAPSSKIELPAAAPKKKMSYAKQEIKRTEELEAKVKEYEASMPDFKKKIEELESRLNEGIPKSDHLALQEKLDKLQLDRDQKEAQILKERDELATRVEMLDLVNSPTFKQKYDAPIDMHYRNIMGLISVDPSLKEDLNKLFIAHNSGLQAADEQSQIANFQMRDDIEQSIFDRLHPSKGYRFIDAVQNLYSKARDRFEAIANHSEVKKNFEKNAYEDTVKRKQYWKDLYDQTGKDIVVSYPEEIEKIIRSKQIDDDIRYDEEVAAAALDERAQLYPQRDIVRILHQGKASKRKDAIIQAQKILIDEMRETMDKFKRAESSGGAPSSLDVSSEISEKKEMNLDEFIESNWGASRQAK